MRTIDVPLRIPPKLIPVFTGPARYRGAKGGRGSGKTRTFAKMTAVRAVEAASQGKNGVILCAREFMNSLEESSLPEVKAAIESEPMLARYMDVGEKYVRTRGLPGRVDYRFAGLRHNVDSLKSKATIILAWIDEGEGVPEVSWRKLIPTVREDGSEIWLTWNPEKQDSPTNQRFVVNPPANAKIVEINYDENPWFPDVLEEERRNDERRLDPNTYAHIWNGAYLVNSDAQVFAGKWRVDEFKPGADWDGPYQGGDFGFSQDPTAAVRCWVHGDNLYIEYEAFAKQLLDTGLPAYVEERIPGFGEYVSRWDAASPGSIELIRRWGFDRATAVEKWQGSVEDGIRFMRSFKEIVVHPRCKNVAREMRLYSYKVDRLSGDVLPKLQDGNDHGIDAARYALAPLIRKGFTYGMLEALD